MLLTAGYLDRSHEEELLGPSLTVRDGQPIDLYNHTIQPFVAARPHIFRGEPGTGPRYKQIIDAESKDQKDLEQQNKVQLQNSGQAAQTQPVSGSRIRQEGAEVYVQVAGKLKLARGAPKRAPDAGATSANRASSSSASIAGHAPKQRKSRVCAADAVIASCASVLGDASSCASVLGDASTSPSPDAKSMLAMRVFDDDSELDIMSILNGAKLGRSVRAVASLIVVVVHLSL